MKKTSFSILRLCLVLVITTDIRVVAYPNRAAAHESTILLQSRFVGMTEALALGAVGTKFFPFRPFNSFRTQMRKTTTPETPNYWTLLSAVRGLLPLIPAVLVHFGYLPMELLLSAINPPGSGDDSRSDKLRVSM